MIDSNKLKQINLLEETHCEPCTKIKGLPKGYQAIRVCKVCSVGKEIMQLGQDMQVTKENKVLSKGEEMSFSDIMDLLKSSVPVINIIEALGWSVGKFRAYMNQHGVDPSGNNLKNRKGR